MTDTSQTTIVRHRQVYQPKTDPLILENDAIFQFQEDNLSEKVEEHEVNRQSVIATAEVRNAKRLAVLAARESLHGKDRILSSEAVQEEHPLAPKVKSKAPAIPAPLPVSPPKPARLD